MRHRALHQRPPWSLRPAGRLRPADVGAAWIGTDPASQSRRAMALVLAAMAAAASAVGLLSYLGPQVPIPDTAFQVAITLSGVVSAALLLVARHRLGERMPMAVMHTSVAASSVMICLGSWSARTSPTAVASLAFFVWMGLFAGHFFSTRQVAAHLAWIGACLAVLLAANGNRATAAVGIMTYGIVVAATGASHYLAILLRRVALTDELTGLPNRQALDALMRRELARADRAGSPLSVAVVDIDRFKEINDTSGHMAGDALLVALAANLRAGLRAVDVVARVGGDELVILMPGCPVADAAAVADRLRIEAGHPCSVGVTQWEPGEPASTMLSRADTALYEAKDAGRDRVVATTAHTAGSGSDPVAC